MCCQMHIDWQLLIQSANKQTYTEQQTNWDEDGCDPQTADVYPLTYPYVQHYYCLTSMICIQVCWNNNALKWELQNTLC